MDCTGEYKITLRERQVKWLRRLHGFHQTAMYSHLSLFPTLLDSVMREGYNSLC
jgi:hypothetical protein